MSQGVVILCWYNRTAWNPPRLDDGALDMLHAKPYLDAIVFGRYYPAHEYESTYGEWWMDDGVENAADVMWRRLQRLDGHEFPIPTDRSMSIGDIVEVDRIDDNFDAHPIAAWMATLTGWTPVPEFLADRAA